MPAGTGSGLSVTVRDRSAPVGPEGVTVNAKPLLGTPPTVTMTGPVVAPDGTTWVIDVLVHVVALAAVWPLNETVLAPCGGAPKLEPVMVTVAPTAALDGEMFVTCGV